MSAADDEEALAAADRQRVRDERTRQNRAAYFWSNQQHAAGDLHKQLRLACDYLRAASHNLPDEKVAALIVEVAALAVLADKSTYNHPTTVSDVLAMAAGLPDVPDRRRAWPVRWADAAVVRWRRRRDP